MKMTVHCVAKLQSKNVSSILIQYLQFNRSQKRHEMRVRSFAFYFFFHDSLAIKCMALPKCSLLDIFLWDSEVNIVFVILKINAELGNSHTPSIYGTPFLVAQHVLKYLDMAQLTLRTGFFLTCVEGGDWDLVCSHFLVSYDYMTTRHGSRFIVLMLDLAPE